MEPPAWQGEDARPAETDLLGGLSATPAREIVGWYDEDPARQQVDARLDAVMDKLAAAYRA